jgi:serine protease Do
MKQSILNSLTIVLLLLLPVEKTFGQLPELVAKNEKAVFSIYTYDEYGSANGMGTGFFIDGKGIGFTNYHVLEGATKAVIKLTDKSVYEIDKIIAADADADVVKFSVKNFDSRTFSYLTLKTTQPLKGSDIFVIGNPEGFENTVSEGIVSSIREIEGFGDIIQITAPISPGSSGSPVMTMDGKVVGIATFQLKEGQNINFAISCKKALDISSNSEISLANIGSEIIILNLPCETSPQFVLNSIELSESSTILHFSYTNLNIAWGDNGFVFSKVGKKNDGMFITDLSSGMNYYNNYSSIETKKTVKLGETKRYREVFPSLPKSANKLNIVEGEHGHVSFYNIDLDKYREIAGKDVSNYLKNP